jgi:hypothetical protein
MRQGPIPPVRPARKPQDGVLAAGPPAARPGVRIRNLCVGDAAVDPRLERHRADVGVNVLRRNGDVEIAVVK